MPAVTAPTPPAGPTTYAAITGMVVGVIIAVLSLFDVAPTDADVQAIGTITGAAIALVAFVVSAISRTKQANNLAALAAAERKAAPLVVAPAGATDAQMSEMARRAGGVVLPSGSIVAGVKTRNWSAEPQALGVAVHDANAGEPVNTKTLASYHGAGRRASDATDHDVTPRDAVWGTHLPSSDEIVAWDRVSALAPEVGVTIGAPADKSLEVPGGGVRPSGVDVGGEAPPDDLTTMTNLITATDSPPVTPTPTEGSR